MDDEIHYIANQFERVVVAPMRVRQEVQVELPENVVVELSLSRYLAGVNGSSLKRYLRACKSLFGRNPGGWGCRFSDLVRDWYKLPWLKQLLISRADAKSVYSWSLTQMKPSLAYTFWLGAATVGVASAWRDIPTVSRAHGYDLFSEASGWNSIPYQRKAIEQAALVSSVSDAGQIYLEKRFSEHKEKLTWRRLGIQGPKSPIKMSGTEKLCLVSASSVDNNKRVNLIAEVVLKLHNKGIEVSWTHFGDGPEFEAVERLIEDHHAASFMNLAGKVSIDELLLMLESGKFNVFINLSLSEGAPVSLMEAQSFGLPVVATAVGGTPEVVPAHLNELVSISNDDDEICDAIMRAIRRAPDEYALRWKYWYENYSAQVNYELWAKELNCLSRNCKNQSGI